MSYSKPRRSISLFQNKTMPISHQNNPGKELNNTKSYRSTSLDEGQSDQVKLPTLQIKKVMKKIGAAQKQYPIYVPSDEEQNAFRKSKWAELRGQYYNNKQKKKAAFDYQLDEIVLGCWQYGEDFGNKTIWRKYKQKFDELSFDTLKVVKKKRL